MSTPCSVKIMRKFGILLVCLAGTIGASAQHAPSGVQLNSIARDPVAYRKILDKFIAGVERPSVSECTIAYYGFALQDYYNARVSGEEDMQRAIMAGDYQAAYRLGCDVLEHSPVNLSALYWTLYAATEIVEPWEVRNSLKGRYNSISFVISASGDGLSPETALKTIWVGDMYTYTTQELGLSIGEGYLWDNRYTQFDVTPLTPSARFKHDSIFFEQWVEGPGGAVTVTAK